MPLLIDGYNLLHVTGIFGRTNDPSALHGSREALLDYLAAAIDQKRRSQTTIVFDAAGAPPGLPKTVLHEGMTVHFARGYPDADAMIEELLERHAAPRSLLVVSGDHRVQRAARQRGAAWVDSDRWYSELRAEQARGRQARDAPVKPAGAPSPAEVDYWVDKFADPCPDVATPSIDRSPEATDPFPPGYAEDLLDEGRGRTGDDRP